MPAARPLTLRQRQFLYMQLDWEWERAEVVVSGPEWVDGRRERACRSEEGGI